MEKEFSKLKLNLYYLPLIIFGISSVLFLFFEYNFSLIENHYIFVHFLFGLLFPLLTGYIPLYIFVNKHNLKNINTWNLEELNSIKPKWSISSGIFITSWWSIGNEVFTDLKNSNETIFQNDNWHHLIADFLGMILVFILVQFFKKTSNKYMERNKIP